MTSFSIDSLVFSPGIFLFYLGIAILIAMAALCVIGFRRAAHKKTSAALESLRFLATLAAVLLLWKPEWRTIITPDSQPEIAILWDASHSMDTADQRVGNSAIPRSQFVQDALKSEFWKPLESKNRIRLESFSPEPKDADASTTSLAGTDLYQALDAPLQQSNNLRAVILLSDGDANLGKSPVTAAQRYRQRKVPIFSIPVGSPTRLPDLAILEVKAPSYGIIGENVQIPFTIRSSLDRDVRTKVRLRNAAGQERTKDIRIPAGAEFSDTLLWRIEAEGTQTLTLSIPNVPGELVESNNSRAFTLSGRRESIKVLLIESQPRWEYRFIRNALMRDPGVEVDCLLFHPTLGMGSGPRYLNQFPEEPEKLSKYDVIFLGDVGTKQLTTAQLELIKGLVESQASGLVLMPGPLGHQLTLTDSPLSELIPVLYDQKKKEGFSDPSPSKLELTPEGRNSLLTLLADTEEENPNVWRNLPGFYWHTAVDRAKAGTEILAVHESRLNSFGKMPLLVTKSAGEGKVLFMGSDAAWRWRRGVEDLYHYRFWGQVARWMSYQRNMAAGELIRVMISPERPKPGDVVTLTANAFDEKGVPLKEGKVRIDLTGPDGNQSSFDLSQINGTWGSFNGNFKASQPGAWKLKATVSTSPDKPIDTTVLVQGDRIEQIGQPARPEVMEEIARTSQGRVVDPALIPQMIDEISRLKDPEPIESRLQLWNHWIVGAFFVLLLAIFWIGRKLNGTF